jgi:hypothetical protein
MYQITNLPDVQSGNLNVFGTDGFRTIRFILDPASAQTFQYTFSSSTANTQAYQYTHQPNLTSQIESYQQGYFYNVVRTFTSTTIGNTTSTSGVTGLFLVGAPGALLLKIKVIAVESSGVDAFSSDMSATFVKGVGIGSLTQIGTTVVNSQSSFSTADATLSVSSPTINLNLIGEPLVDLHWFVRIESFFDIIY